MKQTEKAGLRWTDWLFAAMLAVGLIGLLYLYLQSL
jgi:hypothetical protein